MLGVIPQCTNDTGRAGDRYRPKSPPSEAYRTLRSNLRFSLFDKPAKTFLVTSAGAGEGKSQTAANLAIAYAQSGEAVILVDADLRRPILDRLLGVNADVGVTNVLVGDNKLEDALMPTEVPGLRLLTSGPLPLIPPSCSDRAHDRPVERLPHSPTWSSSIRPRLMLTDAAILSAKVDHTIIVAESGGVTERAPGPERRFRHARADVLGIVLNKLRITGSDYYYLLLLRGRVVPPVRGSAPEV